LKDHLWNMEKNRTILCVDDDVDDLELLTKALEMVDKGYHVIEASDGTDALDKLWKMHDNNTLPCLIVLDINMPKMDGKETLIALQREDNFYKIPVVVFSTSSSALDKLFFAKKNVELITKPINFQNLVLVAQKLLSYCD
jgi:CheY-like chemotaxis protein